MNARISRSSKRTKPTIPIIKESTYMISLDNYAKYVNDLTTSRKENSEMKITIMNIDAIFRHLLRMGVEEVEVNKYQMSMITSLFVAGCGKTEVGAKAMLEGRIDTFFGIKLKLI